MDVSKKVQSLLSSDNKQNKENMSLEQFVNKFANDLEQKKNDKEISQATRWQIIKSIYVYALPYFISELFKY